MSSVLRPACPTPESHKFAVAAANARTGTRSPIGHVRVQCVCSAPRRPVVRASAERVTSRCLRPSARHPSCRRIGRATIGRRHWESLGSIRTQSNDGALMGTPDEATHPATPCKQVGFLPEREAAPSIGWDIVAALQASGESGGRGRRAIRRTGKIRGQQGPTCNHQPPGACAPASLKGKAADPARPQPSGGRVQVRPGLPPPRPSSPRPV